MYTVDHLKAKHAERMEQLSKDQEKSARRLQYQLQQIDEGFSQLKDSLVSSLSTSVPQHIKPPRIGGFMAQLRGFFL
ncbi:MAG: hypothetical protein MI749_09515 [Desulfovibrionales bacterium]|nr:hypothetical protein [Desulfovibrionales bacterium]